MSSISKEFDIYAPLQISFILPLKILVALPLQYCGVCMYVILPTGIQTTFLTIHVMTS